MASRSDNDICMCLVCGVRVCGVHLREREEKIVYVHISEFLSECPSLRSPAVMCCDMINMINMQDFRAR